MIIVLAIGRSGCQIVNYMIDRKLEGVEFAAMRFHGEFLESCKAPLKFDARNIYDYKIFVCDNFFAADMLFIISDVELAFSIARTAKPMGILTAGISLTCNQNFNAVFQESVNAFTSVTPDMSIEDRRKFSFDVVETISSLITKSGFVNLDFDDVKNFLEDSGAFLFGTGYSENAKTAAHEAINMCDTGKIKSVLMNITAGAEITLSEIMEAAEVIEERANYVVWGHVIDENAGEGVRVSIIAGIDK